MKKQKRSWNGVGKQEHPSERLTMLSFGLLFLVIIAGCASPSPQAPSISPPPVAPPAVAACTTKECFISSANDCNDVDLTLTQDAGVFKYSSSKDCVFTKTLVSLNANETQEMKSLLQGKSLMCRYKKGTFDQRWVTSLIFGTEYCTGELRDILAELIAFA